MKKEFKLTGTGNNNIVNFSRDGSMVAIGAADGAVKIYDLKDDRLLVKTKIKGPKREIIISYQDLSYSQKYFAFSCLHKVYILDLSKKEIIKDIEYAREEKKFTTPFSFFGKADKLVVPDGLRLQLYSIETDASSYIDLPQGCGHTECISVSEDDKLVAYKSGNPKWEDKLFIFNMDSGAQQAMIDLPYDYIPGKQMYAAYTKFISGDRVAVLRRSKGLSYFDAHTGKEIRTITWEEMGFRGLGSFHYTKMSSDGRYLFFKKENPDNYDLEHWSVPYPGGCEYVLYDTEAGKIIYNIKNENRGGDFHMETGQVAYLWYDPYPVTDPTEFLMVERM